MILELHNIYKTYIQGKMEVPVLKDISLSVDEGEYVAIMGPSGSGKTTLMNIIGCLDLPTSGTYALAGENIIGSSESKLSEIRLNSIGFVFQSYNNLPQYTALENVALPLAIRGVPEDERNWLAWQALSRVGLRGHVDHRPAELSGGQQQRVSIARAIITEPSIVLADEPTGNLDSRTGQEVMELLCEIFRERNTTFVLSSHDPQMQCYTDRTVYFSDGKIETENHHTGEERTQ